MHLSVKSDLDRKSKMDRSSFAFYRSVIGLENPWSSLNQSDGLFFLFIAL